MELFNKRLEKFICHFVVAMTAIMILIGNMQVIYRYVLQKSLTWSEETMRYMNIWITMIGACYGYKKGYFSVITLLSDYLKERSKVGSIVLNTIRIILAVFFFSSLAYFGYRFAIVNMRQLTAATRIPMGLIDIIIPISGIIGLLFVVEEISTFRKNNKGRSEKN